MNSIDGFEWDAISLEIAVTGNLLMPTIQKTMTVSEIRLYQACERCPASNFEKSIAKKETEKTESSG